MKLEIINISEFDISNCGLCTYALIPYENIKEKFHIYSSEAFLMDKKYLKHT